MSAVTSPTSSRAESPAPQSARLRANRDALRDYYGLKPTTSLDATPEPSPQLQPEVRNDSLFNELDDPNLDPNEYVKEVLATKRLAEILKIERGLISEIKSLNGEKKALVYDNYSKLISATDTIRKMRDNMGPLMPEDSSLNDDIAHIATTVEKLALKPETRREVSTSEKTGTRKITRFTKRRQLRTVKWALDAPQRLQILLEEGKRSEAQGEWERVAALLNKWKDVRGAEELKENCERVMRSNEDTNT